MSSPPPCPALTLLSLCKAIMLHDRDTDCMIPTIGILPVSQSINTEGRLAGARGEGEGRRRGGCSVGTGSCPG